MSDKAFTIIMISLAVAAILGATAMLHYFHDRERQQMIQAGYEYKQVPATYGMQWVKGEPK